MSSDDLAFDEFIRYDSVAPEDQLPELQRLKQPPVASSLPYATNDMRVEYLETTYQQTSHDEPTEVIGSDVCLSINIGVDASRPTDFSPGSSLDQNISSTLQDLGKRQEKKQAPKGNVVVFSANPNDGSIHRRGRLNAFRRQEVERVRKARACIQCKSRKIPVRSRKLTKYLNSN